MISNDLNILDHQEIELKACFYPLFPKNYQHNIFKNTIMVFRNTSTEL